jgi:formamidopyrimidine-DNA glycosylase
MPELPEVETVKRGLEPVFTGSSFTAVHLHRDNLRTPFPNDMVERLIGKTCRGLRRRGKYIWIDLNSGETLVVHLGMSGSFTINPTEPKKHDHVIFETDRGDQVVYHDPRRFGMMFFVLTGQEDSHPAFTKMGPEPMGNHFHADAFMTKIKHKKSPIKSALLDQTVVAGIGNIYACEALYEAGISPLRVCHRITKPQADRLVSCIRDVLDAAIQSGGSSLRDHRQTDGTMGYFQHGFKVYDREGHLCNDTGGVIKRIVQSGRSTFYCPAKQK